MAQKKLISGRVDIVAVPPARTVSNSPDRALGRSTSVNSNSLTGGLSAGVVPSTSEAPGASDVSEVEVPSSWSVVSVVLARTSEAKGATISEAD
jgi:predicted solute-binding protein